jgi:hypothetical protein
MKPFPVAILFSDLHLTLQRPACRADEDWMGIQQGYLYQVKELAGWEAPLPIFFAGDLFDRWNPQPELITWALQHLPDKMMCVPGQHDLPNHRLDQMHKSGYGVLAEAGKIVDITGHSVAVDDITAHGFGWGMDIEAEDVRDQTEALQLAVIHKYCWIKGADYPGAPKDSVYTAFSDSLEGFDAAVFGDNHKGFSVKTRSECNLINTGGFIRRKSDEIDYKPRVGILMDDGSVQEHFLDTAHDVFHEKPKERPEIAVNMAEFIRELEDLGEHGLNYRGAVEDRLRADDIETETREIILKALEI